LLFEGELAQPLTEDVRKAFVEAYRGSRVYGAAKSLHLDALEPEVAKLRDETGLTIEIEVRSFHECRFRLGAGESRFLHIATETAEGKTSYNFDWMRTDDGRRGKWVLMVKHRSPDAETAVPYLARPEDFRELDFQFVDAIVVRHPLCKPVFSVDESGVKLSDFVKRFCREHDVDYAIAPGGNDPLMSLRLKNRGFTDCVDIAAKTTGRSISIWSDSIGTPHDRAARFEDLYSFDSAGEIVTAMLKRVRTEADNVHRRVTVQIKLPRDAK
jgi:hypothetical protein